MNLTKAKKITILVLVVLNAVLLALRINERTDYTLSSAREKAVYEVLGKNNIALYTELLRSYEPMQRISVTSVDTDINKILPAFFGDLSSVNMTIEFSKTIYSDDYTTLTLGENSLIYENSKTDAAADSSYNQAHNIANNFCDVIRAAMSFSNTLELEKNSFNNGEYIFRYVENYNGNKIFCNHIDITVKNDSVINAEASRYGIDGMTGAENNIAAPDEAMLTLLYELKKGNLSYGVIITNMEIGYDLQSSSDIASGDSLTLVPCYRVYIQGINEPYTINAYTNEII